MRAIILIIFAICMMGTVKAQQRDKLTVKDSLKHVEKLAKIEAELEIARINADKPIIESPGFSIGLGFNPFFNPYYNRPFYNNGFYDNGLYRNRRPIIIKRKRRNGNNRINNNPVRRRVRSRVSPAVRSNRRPQGKNPRRKVQARQRRRN